MTTYPMALNVPHFDEEKLGQSSLILADLIEKVPTSSIGAGQFVIGDTKVRPRINDTFKRDEKLGIYTQFYNFWPDEKTKKPNGDHPIRDHQESARTSRARLHRRRDRCSGRFRAAGDRGETAAALKSLEPGQYTLKMKVVDKNRNQTLTPTASFTVK